MEQHQFGLREWADLCERKDATIAALQARVQELEARQHFGACAKCLTNAWRICKEGTPDAVEMKCSNGSTWWLCDYCLSKEQLTQRTAELEAAQRKVDLAEKKAWLAAHDVGFFSMWNGTDYSGPPKLALLCNDTFAWATADCEDVLDEQIDTIVELFKSEGEAGVIKWIAQQRNMKPMESVGKWLFGCDAIKKERDDLQAELERVRGERDVWYARYNELSGVKDRQLNDLQAELERVRGLIADLRKMVAALPKVEGAVVVSNGYVKDSTRCHALFGADEDAALYAALLQHRQGMEG